MSPAGCAGGERARALGAAAAAGLDRLPGNLPLRLFRTLLSYPRWPPPAWEGGRPREAGLAAGKQ